MTKKNSQIVYIGIFVFLAVLLLGKYSMRNSEQTGDKSLTRNPSSMLRSEASYTDFATWKRQTPTDVPFFFYVPKSVELTSLGEKKYQLSDSSNPSFLPLTVEMLTYPDFQTEKMALDKAKENVFGWTNAYGESVFEYEHLEGMVATRFVSFVVAVDKHAVMKFSTEGEESIKLAKNISRTVQRTELDKYQEVRIVNYTDNYFVKVPASLLEQPMRELSPFVESFISFPLARKTEVNTPNFEFVANVDRSNSATNVLLMTLDQLKEVTQNDYVATYVSTIFPGNVKGVVYRLTPSPTVNRDLEPHYSVVFQKENAHYFLTFPLSKHLPQYEMNQVFKSFRFLTDQEKMIP